MKVVAALRNQFGGHVVTAAAGSVDTGADSRGADATDAWAPVDGAPDPSAGLQRGAPGEPPRQ